MNYCYTCVAYCLESTCCWTYSTNIRLMLPRTSPAALVLAMAAAGASSSGDGPAGTLDLTSQYLGDARAAARAGVIARSNALCSPSRRLYYRTQLFCSREEKQQTSEGI